MSVLEEDILHSRQKCRTVTVQKLMYFMNGVDNPMGGAEHFAKTLTIQKREVPRRAHRSSPAFQMEGIPLVQ